MFSKLFRNIKVSESQLWKEQIAVRTQLRDVNLKHWLNNNVFSLVWWIMLIFIITIWLLWWKYVNKARLMEIATYGLMISIVSTILDLIGTEFVLWGYPNMLIPSIPPLIYVDFGAIPVAFMLTYQHFNSWKSFSLASLTVSAAFAFVFEPITVWLNIYQMNNWKHIYSFPIFFVMAMFFRWVVIKIKVKQKSFV